MILVSKNCELNICISISAFSHSSSKTTFSFIYIKRHKPAKLGRMGEETSPHFDSWKAKR